MNFHGGIAEKTLMPALTVLFLVLFMGRTIGLRRKLGKAVRGEGTTVAIVFTTVLFALTNFAVLFDEVYSAMIPLTNGRPSAIAGYVLYALSIVLGAFSSRRMRDSWRVGIVDGDRPELIREGMFAVVRNPYFLSYYLMFAAFVLIRPSVVGAVLAVAAVVCYHRMVLREEAFLTELHGDTYRAYRRSAGRYLPRLFGRRG